MKRAFLLGGFAMLATAAVSSICAGVAEARSSMFALAAFQPGGFDGSVEFSVVLRQFSFLTAALLGVGLLLWFTVSAFKSRMTGYLAAVIAVALLAPALFVDLAHAQAAAAGIDVGGVWGAWRQTATDIAGTAIAVLVAFICWFIQQKLRISISDSMRDAFQQALTNGAGLVLNKLDNNLKGKTVTTGSPGIDQAVEMVLKSAPDAIKYFGITPEMIREKLVAKVPVVANTTPTA